MGYIFFNKEKVKKVKITFDPRLSLFSLFPC